MLEPQKAADYLVVAWCKNWSMLQYLGAIMEKPIPGRTYRDMVLEAVEAYPWMTSYLWAYRKSVREFVGGAYPNLNRWLWDRPDDLSRLKCASEIQKLRPPAFLRGFVSAEDRKEMKSASKAERTKRADYWLARDQNKTHGRSAWNVCKA